MNYLRRLTELQPLATAEDKWRTAEADGEARPMPIPPAAGEIRWEQRQSVLNGPQEMLKSLLASPAFPAWLLHEAAAADPREEIRVLVARHSAVRTDTLELLSRDERAEVRRAVVRAEKTGLAVLRRLVCDGDAGVRAGAAAHPKLSDDEAIQTLLNDREWEVRSAVVRSVRFQRRQHWLNHFVDDPSFEVRTEVAKSAWATPGMLVSLSRDPSPCVRISAAHHVDLPRVELRRLMHDPEPDVAEAAQDREKHCQICLRTAQGERLWRLLVASWGPPRHVSQWPETNHQRLVCFECYRDGYGGGNLTCRRARPEDLMAALDPMLVRTVYAFSEDMEGDDWQSRLEDPSWERLSDVPFLP